MGFLTSRGNMQHKARREMERAVEQPSVHWDIIKGKIYALSAVNEALFALKPSKIFSLTLSCALPVMCPCCNSAGCSWQWKECKILFVFTVFVKGEIKRVNFYVIAECNEKLYARNITTYIYIATFTNTVEREIAHYLRWGYGKCFEIFGVRRPLAFDVDVSEHVLVFVMFSFSLFVLREE